jgi:diguanylate cyclase (GGDEF)-like protein/PAS domain S-box-containing protein
MSAALRILHLEDDPNDVEIVRATLDAEGIETQMRAVARRDEFLQGLREGAPDLILADYNLPGFDGMEALALARHHAPAVPFIFVSGTLGEEVAIRSLQEGATDYVFKERLVRLAPAIHRALGEAVARAVRQQAEEALLRQKEYTAHVFDAAPTLIFGLTPDGVTTFVNPAVTRCTGYEANDLLGRDWWSIFYPGSENSQVESFLAMVRRGQVRDHEMTLTTSTGEKRTISWTSLNRYGDQGQLLEIVGMGIDVSEKQRAEETLQHAAFHDALTGLPNRALFLDRIRHASARQQRRFASFALLMLGLDRFKNLNDSFGHVTGDRFLCQVAERLTRTLRPGDTLARLGGDEFAVILEDVGLDEAAQAARRIQEALRAPMDVDGRELVTTASIGIAVGAGEQRPLDTFRNADIAMARAKRSGRDTHVVFDEGMHDELLHMQQLEADLRRALSEGQLRLLYQPIVSMETGAIAALEALVRWQHPARGVITPQAFIPLAEETGLIHELDDAIMRQAAQDMATIRGAGLANGSLKVNVNVSSREFARVDYAERLGRVLKSFAMAPASLRLEITEGTLLLEGEATHQTVTQLQALGVDLVLDDFGTGYSSLSYLHRFPLAALKIDKSFVARVDVPGREREIVDTILALGERLDMEVTAEGVETASQLEELRALGCPFVQGYYLSLPLEFDAVCRLLGTGGRLPALGAEVSALGGGRH